MVLGLETSVLFLHVSLDLTILGFIFWVCILMRIVFCFVFGTENAWRILCDIFFFNDRLKEQVVILLFLISISNEIELFLC